MTKLWLLKPNPDLTEDQDPWDGQHDRADGFVILATSAEGARMAADILGGDENRSGRRPWMDPQLSSCEELKAEGPPALILGSFREG